MVKLLIVLQPNEQILLQIMQDDKALAYITLDKEQALQAAANIEKLANKITKDNLQ